MTAPIALLTDFGTEDWYVASMKGVLLSQGVKGSLVDISHSIEPGNIREAAFVLVNCFTSFPLGTVFLVVVDPGVGSDRIPIVLKAGGYFFVGPDNGVFSYVMERVGDCLVRRVQIPENEDVSATFHGRDVFSPCAAKIATGKAFDGIGPVIEKPVLLDFTGPSFREGEVVGKIVYIDHFGNCITNIHREKFSNGELSFTSIFLESGKQIPLQHTYSEVDDGSPLCLWGSSDWLEISLNGGNASEKLGLRVGDVVKLKS